MKASERSEMGGSSGLQLVPLLDFANHCRHEPDADPPIVEYADGMTVLCASAELQKGDEATFTYCEEGNERLLLDYGFAQLGEDEYAGLSELDALLDADQEAAVKRLWAW